jgi:hypothetical protein
LKNQALQAISKEHPDRFALDILDDANNHLIQDIQAALDLGDINYLRSNIDWVEGLIGSRSYDGVDFESYLQSFIEIAEKNLSSEAQPLMDWLRAYLGELG